MAAKRRTPDSINKGAQRQLDVLEAEGRVRQGTGKVLYEGPVRQDRKPKKQVKRPQ